MESFGTSEKKDIVCSNGEHHFVDLTHYTHGSECHCKKCGLTIKFNRGWPERIEPREIEAFLQKYEGSIMDLNFPLQ